MTHSVAAPEIGFPWRTYRLKEKATKKNMLCNKKMVHKLEMTNKYLQYNKYYVTGTYNTRSNY